MVVVIEIVRTNSTPVTTTAGEAVVDVVSGTTLVGAYIGTTPPADPYENQVWIDIS